MKELHKYFLFRILMVSCGYLCLVLAGLSTFIQGDPNAVFLGILTDPWIEWTIFAILLFAFDMFVTPRYRFLFEEK